MKKLNLVTTLILPWSLLLGSLQEEKMYEEIPDQCTLSVKNPDLANRQTAKLRLKNGLEVYLVSDPGADQSAAALSVEVGSWSDPEEYPGTAHFVEHMLFMGTEAYPEEHEFFPFVLDNSGSLNAYTASDRTVYMFSLNHEGLEEALDRFSHFFIDPLFNPSGVGRELHAVDQENDKNLENDAWRAYMVFKETGNPSHPNAKFSTGNSKTLGKIPVESLHEWFNKNYSSNLMHLSVYSPLPMDLLVNLISEYFSRIPNREAKPLKNLGPLTSKNQMGHLIGIAPIQDIRELSLMWEVPKELAMDIDSKVSSHIKHALNHGHERGLNELLKKEGLAESISCSSDRFSKENMLLSLNISLTKKGVQNVEEIIKICFQHLTLLREGGAPAFLFEERKKTAELAYQYQSRANAYEFVMHHAHSLIDEPIETYPQKTFVASHFSAEKVNVLLKHMTPQNCIFSLIADPSLSGMQPQKKERWLGGEYVSTKLPDSQLSYLANVPRHPSLGVPKPNPYIPDSLNIVSTISPDNEAPQPKLIADESFGKAYFAEDPKYQVPESIIVVSIKSPLIDDSPTQKALLELYVDALSDHLSPLFYEARSASLYPYFSLDDMKLTITLNGYSEKAPELLSKILITMKTFAPSTEKFKTYKESYLSYYKSNEKAMPIAQANEILFSTICNNAPKNEDMIQAHKNLSAVDLQKYSEKLLAQVYVEGMFVGNLYEKDAKDMWRNIKQTISAEPYPSEQHSHPSILLLPQQSGPFVVKEKIAVQGNAALLMLQEGPFSFPSRASQMVLDKALSQSFFETLRTKQQTGYIAKSSARSQENQLLQFFSVQSSTHQPEELLARFELFIEGYVKDFKTALPEERFDHIRNMLISKLLMPLPNLNEYTDRLHTCAFTHDGDFMRTEKTIAALQELTYEKFMTDSIEFLSRKNGKRLAVLLEGVPNPDKDFRYRPINSLDLKNIGAWASKNDYLDMEEIRSLKNSLSNTSTTQEKLDILNKDPNVIFFSPQNTKR